MLKRFDYRHISMLQEWLAARGIPLIDCMLPEFGLVSYQDGIPAACAFLRKAEGNYGIFDGLTSNPTLPGPIRHKALDEVINGVTEHADTLGIRLLVAWVDPKITLERSLKHGFVHREDLAFIARRRQA